jgi:hypothetical protein
MFPLVLVASLEPTPLIPINAQSAQVHVKLALMQALAKPVKWVMSFLDQAAFLLVPSLVQHAILMENAKHALEDICLLVLHATLISPATLIVVAPIALLDIH